VLVSEVIDLVSSISVRIIGGGPAGSAAALAALSETNSVHIVEKSSFPRHKVCGEFLSPEIAALLESHGIDTLTRWKTGLAFWRQDLRHPESPRIVRGAMALGAVLKTRARPVIRGLECGTNRVRDSCKITLPWYTSAPAREAILVSDRSMTAKVLVNDRPVTLEPLGMTGLSARERTVRGYGYRIPLSLTPGNLLSFRFEESHAPWRLLGLEVG
jgi:hypothetical protein